MEMKVAKAIERIRCERMEGDKRVLLTGVVNAGRILATEIERLQDLAKALWRNIENVQTQEMFRKQHQWLGGE